MILSTIFPDTNGGIVGGIMLILPLFGLEKVMSSNTTDFNPDI